LFFGLIILAFSLSRLWRRTFCPFFPSAVRVVAARCKFPFCPPPRPDLEAASTSRPPGLPISKLIRKQMANERLERATKRKVFLLLVLPCLGSVLPVLALPLPSYLRPTLAPRGSALTSRLRTIISSR